MVNSQDQIYTDVFNTGLDRAGAGFSQPVLAANFKTVQFVVSNDIGGDATITAFKSNQELPPDISLPASPSNQYSEVGYTDESDGAYYDSANPFAVADDTVKTFNIESTGSRWIILQSDPDDTVPLVRVDITCFSNFK